MFFFSNRLGCLGSILVPAVPTESLLFFFGVLRVLMTRQITSAAPMPDEAADIATA